MDSFPGSFDLIVNSQEFDFGPFYPILNELYSKTTSKRPNIGTSKGLAKRNYKFSSNMYPMVFIKIGLYSTLIYVYKWLPLYFAGNPGVTRYVGSDDGYITG